MAIKRRYTEEEVRNAVTNSISISSTLRSLNLKATGGNYKSIKQYFKKSGIDTSHFRGQGHYKGQKHHHSPKKDMSAILVENSIYTSSELRKRLIREGFLPNKCEICSLFQWLDKPIVLHLDHKNGINDDNRIENLRLLCPNCHSQTDTYCGRSIRTGRNPKQCINCDTNIAYSSLRCKSCSDENRKITSPKKPKIQNQCLDCGKNIQRYSKRCNVCANKESVRRRICKTKINWPDYDTLKQMVEDTSYLATGKKLGVTDNAVRKRLNRKCREGDLNPPL